MDYLDNETINATQANNAINNIVGMISTGVEIDKSVLLLNNALNDPMELKTTGSKLITTTLWKKITITNNIELSDVEITIANVQYGKFFEFGIYTLAGVRITSTNRQETSLAGLLKYPLENKLITAGDYYLAFTTNASSVNFYHTNNVVSETSALVSKLPTTKPTTTATTGFVSYKLSLNKKSYIPNTLEEYTDNSAYRCYGANGSQPWALNTTTGKMAVSLSSGATWVDKMNIGITTGGAWSPIDMVCDGSRLFMLMNDFSIQMSSDLTETATWSIITPPNKSVNATGRPYLMEIWNGYLYVGEYSGATDIVGGPSIYKMNLTTLVWATSKVFSGARHIHSIQAQNSTVMYITMGDYGYGDDVGVWRITSANQSTDTYTRVTEVASDPYPVNLDFLPNGAIIGSGDRPSFHIVQKGIAGNLGEFILSPKNFVDRNSPTTETTRSIKIDANANAYYISQETTIPRLYVSPPPYIHNFPIVENVSGVVARTILSGSYLINYNRRWKAVTFKWSV